MVQSTAEFSGLQIWLLWASKFAIFTNLLVNFIRLLPAIIAPLCNDLQVFALSSFCILTEDSSWFAFSLILVFVSYKPLRALARSSAILLNRFSLCRILPYISYLQSHTYEISKDSLKSVRLVLSLSSFTRNVRKLRWAKLKTLNVVLSSQFQTLIKATWFRLRG